MYVYIIKATLGLAEGAPVIVVNLPEAAAPIFSSPGILPSRSRQLSYFTITPETTLLWRGLKGETHILGSFFVCLAHSYPPFPSFPS